MPSAKFFSQHWPDQPLVWHGDLDRLGAWVRFPEWESAWALTAGVKDRINIWPPRDPRREAARPEGGRLFQNRLDALAAYELGMTLYVRNAENAVPGLRALLAVLERDLDLSPGNGARCDAFAFKGGGDASPSHYDSVANFTVQLRGRKRWQIAPPIAAEPTHSHTCDLHPSEHERLEPELHAYCQDPAPATMPEGARVIDMEPGSVLFLPRGWLHATEGDGPTISMAFVFGEQCWAQLAAKQIVARLMHDPKWRAIPSRDAFRRRAGAMLGELREAAGQVTAEMLAGAEPDPVYVRTAAAMKVLPPEKGETEHRVRVRGEGGACEVGAPAETVPLCRWLARRKGRFTRWDAMRELTLRLDPSDIDAVLSAMHEAGALAVKKPERRARVAARRGRR